MTVRVPRRPARREYDAGGGDDAPRPQGSGASVLDDDPCGAGVVAQGGTVELTAAAIRGARVEIILPART
jgi:hypothetical protein